MVSSESSKCIVAKPFAMVSALGGAGKVMFVSLYLFASRREKGGFAGGERFMNIGVMRGGVMLIGGRE